MIASYSGQRSPLDETTCCSSTSEPDVISVVVPVKNGGADLVRCLEAIGGQRLDDEVEVVVVDSGSTDRSPERARQLGARVHEIPPETFNHGAVRNLGARLSRGEVARLHDAGRACRRRKLALNAHRTAGVGPRRRCLRATTPPRQRDTSGALLPRLPLQIEPTCAASGGSRSAHLRGDAVLERELGDPEVRLEQVPVR